MKKINKRIMSILLCAALLVTSCICAVPVNAQESSSLLTPVVVARNKLIDLTLRAKDVLWIGFVGQEIVLIYSDESCHDVYVKLDEAEELLDKNFDETTQEEIVEVYNNLVHALNNLKVDSLFFLRYYNRIKDEKNENGYYSDELWSAFQTALSKAKASLVNMEPDEITEAFYSLKPAYDNLCKSNTTVGDVNKDGVLDLKDIIIIQQYMAELKELNSSQKFVAAAYVSHIDLYDILDLQKHMAELETARNWDLEYLIGLDINRLVEYDVFAFYMPPLATEYEDSTEYKY